MTKREFLTAIANGEMNEEAVAYAAAELEKMDAANEKRKNTPSKKHLENMALLEELLPLMSTEFEAAGVYAEKLGVSVPKVSAILKLGVAEGKVTKDVVKGRGVYALAPEAE